MIVITLRNTDNKPRDYYCSTYNGLVAQVMSLMPFSDDIDIRIEGGATFGSQEVGNNAFAFTASANGRTVTMRTEPTEVSTPATILGRIFWVNNGYNGTYNFIVTQIKHVVDLTSNDYQHRALSSLVDGTSTGLSTVRYENNYLSFRCPSGPAFFSDDGGGYPGTIMKMIINNNTIAITLTSETSNFQLASAYYNTAQNSLEITNNIIIRRYTGGVANVTMYGAGVGQDNTGWNCDPTKTFTFTDTANNTWTDSIVNTDPVLAGGSLITSDNENPATIITRDARLTSLSSPCRDLADPLTKASVDIVGNARD